VPGPPATAGPPQAPCTWHPDRHTPLSCSRCGRPACPECLTPASVGFHCPECVAQGRAATRAPRTVAGARLGQRPVVTISLIVINLAFFLVTAVQGRSAMDLSGSALYLQGGLIPAEVASGEYWRLVTAGFLHGNLIHIATNMLSLYWLGIPLERILGRSRMLTIYLLSLLGSSVSVFLFSAPVSLTIGASGAVYGLMGALVVTFRRLRLDLRPLIVVLALNIFVTFQYPGLSWQGHLGGLVVGAISGAAMVFPPRSTRRAWQWGVSIGLVVGLAVLTVIRADQLGSWYCVYQVAGQIGCIPAH
jgi:membrane associated rhomboid family serine protease